VDISGSKSADKVTSASKQKYLLPLRGDSDGVAGKSKDPPDFCKFTRTDPQSAGTPYQAPCGVEKPDDGIRPVYDEQRAIAEVPRTLDPDEHPIRHVVGATSDHQPGLRSHLPFVTDYPGRLIVDDYSNASAVVRHAASRRL
jgi:hypothetical protein